MNAVDSMAAAHVSINGLSVRYLDTGGTGPAVLLLHGIGGSLELWSAQFDDERLTGAAGLRLIALDLPGHGLSGFSSQPDSPRSFATFMWQFVDALGLDKVFVAGNSMGGAIALQMHAQKPHRVRGLLLAAAATLGRQSPMPFRLMTVPGLGELMCRAGEAAVRQQIQAIFAPSFVVSDALKSVIQRNIMRAGNQGAFLACLRQMTNLGGQRLDAVNQAHRSLAVARVPVVLLHGRQDAVMPCAHSEWVHQQHPAMRLHVVEHCGHTPQLEAPEVLGAELLALVQREMQAPG